MALSTPAWHSVIGCHAPHLSSLLHSPFCVLSHALAADRFAIGSSAQYKLPKVIRCSPTVTMTVGRHAAEEDLKTPERIAQLRLSGWQNMPGSMSVIEALLRLPLPQGLHSPTPGDLVSLFTVRALEGVLAVRLAQHVDVKTLGTFISLAGTLRKVMYRNTGPFPEESPDWRLVQASESILLSILSRVRLLTVGTPMPGSNAEEESTCSVGGMHTSGATSRDVSGGVSTNTSVHSMDPSSRRQLNSYEHELFPAEFSGTAERERFQGQLFSILLLTYVQERNKQVRGCQQQGLSPSPDSAASDALDAAAKSVGLAPTALRAMLVPSGCEIASTQQEAAHDCGAAVAWGRFASKRFHGRLLPGCCNLQCVQLSGVSEASLATQLCSGCKRMRYCSSKCQREAWLAGGHMLVCGSEARQ